MYIYFYMVHMLVVLHMGAGACIITVCVAIYGTVKEYDIKYMYIKLLFRQPTLQYKHEQIFEE